MHDIKLRSATYAFYRQRTNQRLFFYLFSCIICIWQIFQFCVFVVVVLIQEFRVHKRFDFMDFDFEIRGFLYVIIKCLFFFFLLKNCIEIFCYKWEIWKWTFKLTPWCFFLNVGNFAVIRSLYNNSLLLCLVPTLKSWTENLESLCFHLSTKYPWNYPMN